MKPDAEIAKELAGKIRDATSGYDGFNVFRCLIGVLCGIYDSAPPGNQAQCVDFLLRILKAKYNIEIKGLKPNDPEAFKRERAKIDEDLKGGIH